MFAMEISLAPFFLLVGWLRMVWGSNGVRSFPAFPKRCWTTVTHTFDHHASNDLAGGFTPMDLEIVWGFGWAGQFQEGVQIFGQPSHLTLKPKHEGGDINTLNNPHVRMTTYGTHDLCKSVTRCHASLLSIEGLIDTTHGTLRFVHVCHNVPC